MPLDNDQVLRMGGRVIAAVFLCAALAGCSMPLADLPAPFGVPAGAPARPATEAAFPAVHDMPPTRGETLLEPDEQKRVQRDLERVRDQQSSRAGVARSADEQK